MLCVGLDPDPSRLPDSIASASNATEVFCKAIIDATADLVCAFKPQIAYFASQRAESALENICQYIRTTYPDVTLILGSAATSVQRPRTMREKPSIATGHMP